jgi:predicted transposase/invertase (TIGR01784 family)
MISKFLNPRNDLAFKRIFGTERNKDILIHFLNDIFGRTSNPVEAVTFLKTAQDPEVAAQRASSVDVLCQDAHGDKFIVEMQVADEPGFEKRAQFYAARTYIEQRETGIEYRDLKAVTFLGITGFTLFPDREDYLCHHVMLNLKTLDRELKDFSFSFLELPKFKKKKHQLVSLTERWAYFMKHAENTREEDLPDIIGTDGIIKRAYEELSRYAWSSEELRAYNSVEMKQAADKAILEGAILKAELRGEQRGIQTGIEKGIQTGIETGVQRVAFQMKVLGLDTKTIQQATGFSQEALDKLFDTQDQK